MPDFPAAHSMDTTWFAIDADGYVGVFDSDEGKKVFTKKIPLSIDGLSQKVNFTLAPDEFMKGTYTVEIWYQKNLIGRVTKSLI